MTNDITKELFRSLLAILYKEPLLPIVRQEFQVQDSEQIINLYRGSKEHFQNAGHFWFMVILYIIRSNSAQPEWSLQCFLSEKYTRFKVISQEEFIKQVHWYDFVETTHDFSCMGNFGKHG